MAQSTSEIKRNLDSVFAQGSIDKSLLTQTYYDARKLGIGHADIITLIQEVATSCQVDMTLYQSILVEGIHKAIEQFQAEEKLKKQANKFVTTARIEFLESMREEIQAGNITLEKVFQVFENAFRGALDGGPIGSRLSFFRHRNDDAYALSGESSDALSFAYASMNQHIGTEHLLYGLLFNTKIGELLSRVGISPDHLKTVLSTYLIEDENITERIGLFTPTTKQVLEHANEERQKRSSEITEPEDILLSILDGEIGGAFVVLLKALGKDEITMKEAKQFKKELADKVRAKINKLR
jgi:hypothetical protein